MKYLEFTTTIQAPKSDVWSKLRDLGSIQNYNPSVTKSYYSSDLKEGKDAARICELAPMGIIEETITDWVEGESYTLAIKAVEKLPPITDMTATISLISIDENVTEAKIAYQFRAKNFLGRLMVPMVTKQFEKGLQGLMTGLKVHTETGKLVHSFKDLQAA